MAREIKLTIPLEGGPYDVRNVPDAVGLNELVVAARWQDGGAKYFCFDPNDEVELEMQAGALGAKCTPDEMYDYLVREYGHDVANRAISTGRAPEKE